MAIEVSLVALYLRKLLSRWPPLLNFLGKLSGHHP